MSGLIYPLIRPLLFKLPPERAHHLALSSLRLIPSFCFSKPNYSGQPIQALGLEFAHPIGLSAGFDKNGEYLDALAKLGFSFIELGTVTKRPQLGNPKPRLFRLPKKQALINRMGFNNQGVEQLVKNISRADYRGILGINIGKNKETSLDHAVDDYLFCLRHVYCHASYVAINISSPNTPNLRQLQQPDYFEKLMHQLREEQLCLADRYNRYVPLMIKLSPDEPEEALKRMASTIVDLGLDGIIATNTTSHHEGVSHLPYGKEEGGISGEPLFCRSTDCLRILKSVVGDDLTLIGVGGIDSPETAQQKLNAGATLIQVYTGLIYKGPGLVKQLVENLNFGRDPNDDRDPKSK